MAEAVAVLGAISSALQLVECISNIVSHTHTLVSGSVQQGHERLKALTGQYGSLGSVSASLAQENESLPAEESQTSTQLVS